MNCRSPKWPYIDEPKKAPTHSGRRQLRHNASPDSIATGISSIATGDNPKDESNDPRIVGALQKDKKTRFVEIMDGTSNTLLIAEDAGRPARFNQLGKEMIGAIQKEGGWARCNRSKRLQTA